MARRGLDICGSLKVLTGVANRFLQVEHCVFWTWRRGIGAQLRPRTFLGFTIFHSWMSGQRLRLRAGGVHCARRRASCHCFTSLWYNCNSWSSFLNFLGEKMSFYRTRSWQLEHSTIDLLFINSTCEVQIYNWLTYCPALVYQIKVVV